MQLFEGIATGKWILLGEHSVLRQYPALVFPLPNHKLRLRFSSDFDSPVEATLLNQAINQAFLGAKKFFHSKNKNFYFPEGNFEVRSSIPIAAGLGSSAAFCAALGKFFLYEKLLEEDELWDICTMMENEFHGKSSGMDLAVILRGAPIRFQINQKPKDLALHWQPKIYLCDSSIRASTKNAVTQVDTIRKENPDFAQSIDEKMHLAVQNAEKALCEPSAKKGIAELASSIEKGRECFENWQLIPDVMRQKISDLYNAGALAVKPTGSGGGGYILSLWENPPPNSLALYKAFSN